MTNSFGSASSEAAYSDTGGGRVGGAVLPTGGIGGVQITAASPQPAPRGSAEPSESSEPRTRTPRSPKKPSIRRSTEADDDQPSRPKKQFRTGTAPTDRSGPPSSDRSTTRAESEPTPAAEGELESSSKQVVATTARSPWSAELGWAWYNAYQSFRGVNILKSITSESEGGSGVVTGSLKLGYALEKDAFTAGFNYWQGLSRVTPKGGAADVPPNSTKKDQQKFSLPSRDRYSEYNLNLAYTRSFLDGKLIGTLGYNHFHFSNGNFYKSSADEKPISYANEIMTTLAYTALPYVQPSFTWAHDFDGFKGDYTEFRLDGAFDVYDNGNFGVRLRPYAALSYDFKYNGTDNGWNALEVGLNIPVRLNSFLTLTLTGNYVHPLEDTDGQPRTNEGFWGGVRFSANWGGPAAPAELPQYGKESKMVAADPIEQPWAVSVGGGWRQVNYSFDHRSVAPFDTRSLFNERTRQGSLAFATPGNRQVYDDGVVDARTAAVSPYLGGPLPGTATFGTASASQILGTRGANAEVRFTTSDYSYADEHTATPGSGDDQDSLISPYAKLDREIFRSGGLSFRGGLLYAFTQSGGDTGYNLARLDTTFEKRAIFGYRYSLDNLTTVLNVAPNAQIAVVNSTQYTTALAQNAFVATGDFTPRSDFSQVTTEVARVGTFVRTDTDLNAHDLSVPFSLRYDLGNRVRLEVNVAPGLTVVDATVSTDIDQRALGVLVQPEASQPSGVGRDAVGGSVLGVPLPPRGRADFNNARLPGGVNIVAQQQAGAQANQANQISQATGGGKASVPKNPSYPGKVVNRSRYSRSSSEVLFALSGGASVILDLNEERTFYAELWGKYQWVQDFSLDNGFARTDVDLSSFQAGFGLGYRF